MSPRQVDAVLLETEAHLRDRIDALLELGVPEEAAEREAIESFGGSKGFVRETIDAHQPSRKALESTIVRVALYASLVGVVTPFVAIRFENPYVFLSAFPLLFAVAAVSYRARRVLPLKMGAISVATFLLFWLGFGATMYSLRGFGGIGILPKWSAAEARQNYQSNVGAEQLAKDVRAKRKLILNAPDPLAQARELGLATGDRILSPGEVFYMPARIRYTPLVTSEAISAWKYRADNFAQELADVGRTSRESLQGLNAAEQASALENFVANGPEAKPMLAIWFMLLFGANCLGAALGWARYQLRRVRIVVRVE
jgi:hypothetical protein